jgi:RNA 2',3'-cyclic 3'-phosphodiesterase
MMRLFLAIPIPEEVKFEFLNEIKLPDCYRKTAVQNIHITLFFFGETQDNKIEGMIRDLDDLFTGYKSFDIEINSSGKFPENGFPRIIFLTGEKGRKDLEILSGKIRNIAKKSGFHDSKGFKYHITVARLNEKAAIKSGPSFRMPVLSKAMTFDAGKIILYKSVLTGSGPVYSSIKEWILNK